MRFILALPWLVLCVLSAVTACFAFGTWQAFRNPDAWVESPGKIVAAKAHYIGWKLSYEVDYKFSFTVDGETYNGVTRGGGASNLHEVRMGAESMLDNKKLEWKEIPGEDRRKPDAELLTKDVAVTVRYYPANPAHSTITDRKFMQAEGGWPVFVFITSMIALFAGWKSARVFARKKTA